MPGLLQRQRRYRRLFIAACAVIVTLVAALLWQRTRIAVQESLLADLNSRVQSTRREANLGNRAREQSEDLAAFMLDDLRAELVPLGRTDLLGKSARRTLEYFDSLPPELVTPATLDARSSILATLANVHHTLGDFDQASDHWQRSIEIRQQLLTTEPDNLDRRLALIEAHNEHAIPLREADRFQPARQANQAALALIGNESAADPALLTARASTLFGLGEGERATGNMDGALNYYAQAKSHLPDDLGDDLTAIQILMTLHNNSGYCETSLGDDNSAETSYQAGLLPARRLLELEPENRHWQKELATLLNNLGTIHDERGDLDLARPFFLEALKLRESLVAWDPVNTRWQLDLANSLRNLASLELSAEAPEEALPLIRRSLRIRLNLLAREPDNTPWIDFLQSESRRFSQRFNDQERPDLARQITEDVRELAEGIGTGSVASPAWNQFLSRLYNDLSTNPGTDGPSVLEARHRSTVLRAGNLQTDPADIEAVYQLAAGYLDLGEDFLDQQQADQALLCFRLARYLFENRTPKRLYRREALIDLCLRHEERLAPSTARPPIISETAVWKYDDRRKLADPRWMDPDFDDSDWKSGPAELGYGDGDESTLLDFGSDPLRKNLTAWFRHPFSLSSLDALSPLRLSLLCDDGAAVYLNGEEILRHGLPNGPITPTTVSNLTVSGLQEEIFNVYLIDPAKVPLRTGTNLIAVEVHQNESASSDLSFALELLPAAPIPLPIDGIDLPQARQTLGQALPPALETWLQEDLATSP